MKFRKATQQDVPVIIQLLANDALGQAREKYADPLPETYYDAFERIHADPNQELIVVEDTSNEIIGTLH